MAMMTSPLQETCFGSSQWYAPIPVLPTSSNGTAFLLLGGFCPEGPVPRCRGLMFQLSCSILFELCDLARLVHALAREHVKYQYTARPDGTAYSSVGNATSALERAHVQS